MRYRVNGDWPEELLITGYYDDAVLGPSVEFRERGPMKRVKVTFYMEPTDEEDPTGLTEKDFTELQDKVIFSGLGAEDLDAELVEA
jgi:hypothetical protein